MGKEVKEKTIIFFMILFIILAIILIFIGFINLKPHFTGKAISVEKESFVISEPIKGTFNLELKEGELIPSNTEVIVTLKKDNKKIVKELSLKELVEISDLKVAEQQGKFFIENKKIEGEGFGYGWPGHYIVYPNVYFQLKVSKIAEESKSQEIEEPLPELPVEQEVEQESQEIMSEQIEEEQSTEQESQKETSQSEETEQSMEQTEQSAGQNLVSITASAVFKMIKFFGIWNSFAVLEENGKYKIIEASCSNENPFFYDLKENEKVELVSGTVHTEDKKLKDDEVNIEIKNNKVEVSTNYFESFEGFGEAYLNKEKHYFSFNLEKLNLKTDEPGTYDLIITLVYRGQELLRESEEIEILPGAITIKVIDKEGNVEDEIAVNNTKIKLKIGKIKVGREIEHELEIEKENLGITGSAIIEQPLPESEINFISMPEDVVIQIDKVPEYQTEVFAIEPSKDIEIESAIITLEKTTAQPIARILQCDEWDIEEFKCNGEWKDSGLEFLDNGTHVSFTTNHFTAYIGESNMTCPYYVNEDVVLVSNVSCNGTAFIINADDVTIDCQGYTINYGITSSGYGISNNGFDNIAIRNCVINGGDYADSSIYQTGSADNFTIMNNNLYSTAIHTLDLREPHNSFIYNNTIYGRIYIETGSNNIFEGNIIEGNDYQYFGGTDYDIINNKFYSESIELDTYSVYFAYNYIEDAVSDNTGSAVYLANHEGGNYVIFNNTILVYADGDKGIYLDRVVELAETNISYNNITAYCDACKGIVIDYPSNVHIENNAIETFGSAIEWTMDGLKNSYGLVLRYASSDGFRYITNNAITTHGVGASGIYLYETRNWNGPGRNVFRDNFIVTEKGYGFEISGDCDDPYSSYPSDIDTSNLVEGKPVYYYCNVSNTEISDLDAGQIMVGQTATWPNPSNFTLKNVASEDGIMLIDGVEGVNITESTINTNNQEGVAAIYIKYAGGSNIYNNELTGNYYGVYDESGNNYVHDNNISNNEYGVVEREASWSQIYSNVMDSNNIAVLLNSTYSGGGGGGGTSYHNISFNNISGGNYGIYLSDEDNNIVEGNTIDNVDYALYIYGTRSEQTGNNQILNNNITNSNVYDFYTLYLNNPGFGDDIITNLKTDNVVSSLLVRNIALKATTSPAPDPSGWQNIGKFLEINNNTENSWLLLNISYLDSEIGSINESTLRLWKYNGSWHQVDSDVDIDNNVVYMNNAEPPSSVYAVMGEGGAIDDEAPRYSQDNDNSTGSVVQGKTVKVYVYWQDNVGLSHAIFRTNESGTWQNVSICSFSGANGWCNATIDTTGDAGKTICWNQYANDTSNNWNTTMSETLHCFRVTTSGGGGGGGGGAYCGDGICNNNENCTTCPEDCHSCGDGCCSPEYGESYSNCWQDCCYPEGVNRPVLPLHVCCPGLNTVIPYDMNCVANQFWQCAGCEAIGAVTCVKCGNGICGPGENFCNCPQDCPLQYNVTDCSELPELDVNASWLESSQEVQLSWNSIYPILKTRIMEADKVQGQNNLSNFSLKQELESWQISWQSQVPERLKFFQVVAKVKIGNLNSECKPECYSQGLNGNKPGWYDPCTETLLKEDSCIVIEPLCCFKGTRSEGWYNAPCDQAQENNRITYAQCEPGEYAIACNQSSGVFVKFTQPLKYNPPTESNPKTSINWIVMMPISGWTINDTKEILQNGMPIDYIAYWDAERQLQYGSARGDPSRGGFFSYGFLLDLLNSVLPGQYLDIGGYGGANGYSGSGGVAGAGGYGGQGGREIVITGPFNLQQGHPYFISATQDWDRWTYVGKVPEHVTFELKAPNPSGYSKNFITLPLDTKITKLSQLCTNIAGMGFLVDWDAAQQVENIYDCRYAGNFLLYAGKSYGIRVNSSSNWTQI
ncbi:MAG: NosD domain-containing protein [Candidatus Pacearchaeota archaeon]